MKISRFAAALFAAGSIVASQAQAQAPDLNAVPDKMPFNVPSARRSPLNGPII